MNRILLLSAIFFFATGSLAAQPDTISRCPVFKGRELFHNNVNRDQLAALKADGRADSLIKVSLDQDVNLMVTYAIINRIDALQFRVECDPQLTNNQKLKYLRSIRDLVAGFTSRWLGRVLPPSEAPALVTAFGRMLEADIAGESYEAVIDACSYATGDLLTGCFGFNENKGYAASRVMVLRKYCELYPEKALAQLNLTPWLPFADSLVKSVAYKYPQQLYDYAQGANTPVGRVIHRNTDSLVQTICRIATDRERRGSLLLPFLSDLYQGRVKFEEIYPLINDSIQYFKALVKTEISYAARIAGKEPEPLGKAAMIDMMRRRAIGTFVNELNRLHDDPDPVRFKIVESLSPQELYYLIVLSEEVMYTSSYRGCFKRMLERMPRPAGDTLLMNVYFDRFRKFLRMAAGYNELKTFLRTMGGSTATSLMNAFTSGLDRSPRLLDIEDAVDVADSYSSILDVPELKDIRIMMLERIGSRYNEKKNAANKKGEAVYGTLHTILRSATDTTVNLTRELGIPPVYSLDYKSLAGDSGRVIQQVFFYGDKDGKDSYNNFMGMFQGADWKVDNSNREWVVIKAARGKPVWIFANKPLDNDTELDARAQDHLNEYLDKLKLRPTIVIHRGHSYHLKYTLEQLAPSAKLVILGSCGGYNNLDGVLKICPDAHIISSKQVGTKAVNEPILAAINTAMRNGRNIDWMPLWKDVSRVVPASAREEFDNYIPPHKNLGAIFIKAYKQAVDALF